VPASQLLTVEVLRRPVESALDTAIRFTQRLADAGIRPSMGSVGDSLDNALAENLFSTLKVELVYRTSFRTREEAELALFRYVDGWYNPHRIQKALGWRSPDEYEADYDRSWRLPRPPEPSDPASGEPGEPHRARGAARRGKVGSGMAWLRSVRRGVARRGTAGHGLDWLGWARRSLMWHGGARLGWHG
jgi:hypothetical protein